MSVIRDLFFAEDKLVDVPELTDERLTSATDTQLLMVGLARLMEAYGCRDEALLKEMYQRAGGRR